jgi:hypothetical protein
MPTSCVREPICSPQVSRTARHGVKGPREFATGADANRVKYRRRADGSIRVLCGASSLSYLGGLPFDSVKIDRTLIRDIVDTPQATALAAAIVPHGPRARPAGDRRGRRNTGAGRAAPRARMRCRAGRLLRAAHGTRTAYGTAEGPTKLVAPTRAATGGRAGKAEPRPHRPPARPEPPEERHSSPTS